MAQNMYRLRTGSKHTARRGGKLIPLKPGDTIFLTNTALKAFGDKFEKAFEVNHEVISGKPMKRLSTSEAAVKAKEEDKLESESTEPEDDESPSLEMKHRGGGRWIVVDTNDDDLKMHEGYLTKKEATALVEG